VAQGGSFLERRVQEGPVLFIALEDPPRRLRERVKRLCVARSAPIQFYTTWPPLNGRQGMEELQLTVAESKPRLVVIDTLARAYDSRVEWNSVGEATAAMAPLQRLAHEHDCCVLTVDHHKKPGLVSNVVDDILGSTGKAAVIDTAWGLYKDRSHGTATLRVTGRDLDTCELPLRFSEGGHCWELRAHLTPCPPLPARGNAPGEGERRVSQEERVAEALRELGGAGTTEEIVQRTGMAKSNVSHALAQLLGARRVRRLAREGHRVPYELVR